MRLIDFNAAPNMVVCSTKSTANQIDLTLQLMEGRLPMYEICTRSEFQISAWTTTLSQIRCDYEFMLRDLRDLEQWESWTSRNWDRNGQLRPSPLNSQILVNCRPTSPTTFTLLRKQSLVSSAHPNETNGTMRSATR